MADNDNNEFNKLLDKYNQLFKSHAQALDVIFDLQYELAAANQREEALTAEKQLTKKA